ncbi:Protein of unknown function [Bacillus mycoides]|jgi:hypothetical protein
MDD